MRKKSLLNDAIVLILTTLIFIIAFGLSIFLSESILLSECDAKAERDLDLALTSFDLELSRSQQSLATFTAVVLDNGKRIPSEEEIYKEMERFLENDPFLTGIIVAYEDSIFPNCPYQYGMSPLVRHQGDSLVRYQLGNVRDVKVTNDWYFTTFKFDMPLWSRPFYSEEGELITCYCMPLHDAQGRKIGVIAVDLPMQRIQDKVKDIKPFPEAVLRILLSTDLTYILHPNPNFVLKETIIGEFQNIGVPINQQMVDDILARKRGKLKMSWGKHTSYFYYAPVEKARCAVIIDVPVELVYASVNKLTFKLLVCLGVGVMLIIIVLLYKNRGDSKPKDNNEE